MREWKVNPGTAELERKDLEALLGPRTKLVAFTHCSNVVGSINAVREFADLAHRAGAWAFVDGVAFAPHGLPDVRELGVDAYCFSLYKVYGPHLGAMYLRREVNAALPNQGHFFNEGLPGKRFTPAGPDHAQIAAVNGVADYMEAIADHHGLGAGARNGGRRAQGCFAAHETTLLQPLLDFLVAAPESAAHRPHARSGSRADGRFHGAGKELGRARERTLRGGFGVGVGNFYAYRLVKALGIDTDDGAVRVSFVHYTSKDEVDRLLRELDRCLNSTSSRRSPSRASHCCSAMACAASCRCSPATTCRRPCSAACWSRSPSSSRAARA